MVKRSIRFRLISAQQFNEHFYLDSPGSIIAKEAFEAGEVITPIEVLEILCLANQLYSNFLLERMVNELNPYGKAAEYLEKRGSEDVGHFLVGILGKNRVLQITHEVMAQVRAEAGIGTGENETAAPVKQHRR
jgi:hypothetical protein